MAMAPGGSEVNTEVYDPNDGIPDSIDNRAAILADQLRLAGYFEREGEAGNGGEAWYSFRQESSS